MKPWRFVSIVYESIEGGYNRKDIEVNIDKSIIDKIDKFIEDKIFARNDNNEIWFSLFTKEIIKEQLSIGVAYLENGKVKVLTLPELANITYIEERLSEFIKYLAKVSKGYELVQIVIPFWKKNSTRTNEFFSFANILIEKKVIDEFKANNSGEINFKLLSQNIIGQFMIDYQKEIQDFFWEKILDGYRKSAITTIMSRNMSHNIGSHVINRVIENINVLNVQDHAYFFKYLQERMDFIAQIATNFNPGVFASFNFLKDVIKQILKQQHLLHYIASAEGLKGMTSFSVQESLWHITLHLPDKKKVISLLLAEGEKIVDIDSIEDDAKVEIPGSVIGNHALYTIFENIIRNSAKHSYSRYSEEYKNKKKNLLVKIYLIEEDDHYIIEISDNYSFISGFLDITLEDLVKISDVSDDVLDKYDYDYKDYVNFINELNEDSFEDIKNITIFADESVKDRDFIKFQNVNIKDVNISFKKEVWSKIDENNIGDSDLICVIVDSSGIDPENLKHYYDKYNRFSYSAKKKIRFIEYDFLKEILSKNEFEKELLSVLKEFFIPLHIKIGRLLNSPIINDDGSLKQHGWGVAEIKICAGFLQGKNQIEINENKDDKGNIIVNVVPSPQTWEEANSEIKSRENKKKCFNSFFSLGYKFKLNKPKLAIFKTNDDKVRNMIGSIPLCEEFRGN